MATWYGEINMKKLIAAALITVAPLAAQAADNWTGAYVGVQLGAEFGSVKGPYTDSKGGNSTPYTDSTTGALIGLRAGYNKEINNLVLGVEADASLGLGTDASQTVGGGYVVKGSNPWNADLRVRLGYDLGDNLVYAAGGIAFGAVKTQYSGLDQTPLAVTSQRVGYTLGLGLEHKFTSTISGTAEYRYTDLGSKSFINLPTDTADKVKYNTSAILLGVNYKF